MSVEISKDLMLKHLADDSRRRATEAQRITDKQIAQVNARISFLSGGTGANTRRVVVHRGTPDEISAAIQAAIDAGDAVYGMAGIYDDLTGRDVVIAVHGVKL